MTYLVRDSVRDLGRFPALAALVAAVVALPALGPIPAALTLAGAACWAVGDDAPTSDDAAIFRAAAPLLSVAGMPAWWALTYAVPGLAPASWGALGVLAPVWSSWAAPWLFVGAFVLVWLATEPPRARARVVERLAEAVADVIGEQEGGERPHVHVSRVGRRWAKRARLDCVVIPYPRGFAGASVHTRERVREVIARELGGSVAVEFRAARRRIVVQRREELPTRAAWQPVRVQGGPPRWPVLAVTAPREGLNCDDAGRGLVEWVLSRDVSLLISGATNGGKTSAAVHLVRTAMDVASIASVVVIDGKREGDYIRFSGRGSVGVAQEPSEWAAALAQAKAWADREHARIAAWRAGRAPEPASRREYRLLLIDEFERVLEGVEEAGAILDELAKTARSVGLRICWVTQRPDVSSRFPGAARDQITARAVVGGAGALQSAAAWQMVFGADAEAARRLVGARERGADATDTHHGAGVIPGRLIASMGGRVLLAQVPWLPDPVEDPGAEALYPPRRAAPIRGLAGSRALRGPQDAPRRLPEPPSSPQEPPRAPLGTVSPEWVLTSRPERPTPPRAQPEEAAPPREVVIPTAVQMPEQPAAEPDPLAQWQAARAAAQRPRGGGSSRRHHR